MEDVFLRHIIDHSANYLTNPEFLFKNFNSLTTKLIKIKLILLIKIASKIIIVFSCYYTLLERFCVLQYWKWVNSFTIDIVCSKNESQNLSHKSLHTNMRCNNHIQEYLRQCESHLLTKANKITSTYCWCTYELYTSLMRTKIILGKKPWLFAWQVEDAILTGQWLSLEICLVYSHRALFRLQTSFLELYCLHQLQV